MLDLKNASLTSIELSALKWQCPAFPYLGPKFDEIANENLEEKATELSSEQKV